MSVSHALSSAVTSTDKEVPGLLEVLAQVPDPRRKRGRRFSLVFVLAVAAVCTLAGARGFRELGDQAGDLPQELLAALGGAPHPLRRHPRDPRRPDPRAMGHRIGPLGPFSAYREDASTGYAGNGPQVMATLRNIAVSLLYLAGITEITRTLQSISRDRNRVLGILPL